MYEEAAKRRFENNKKISAINKKYVKEFFLSYNCSKSRKGTVYGYLPLFLESTKNAKKTMKDGIELAKIFDKLHKRLKPTSYKVTYDIVKVFLKTLNNGEVPETWKKVKVLTKNEKKMLLRANRDDYKLLSWSDILDMCKLEYSIQWKAILQTAADAGLRPQELEQLNYGNCKKDGKFIILHIKPGKTGEARDVLLYKSAPALNRWLSAHPSKKGVDPLWVKENRVTSPKKIKKGEIVRYSYHALKQALARKGKSAGLGSVSFYKLRHSAISMNKQEGLSAEIGAERFGHDIKYYIDVYGKLTPEQKVDRQKAEYGEEIKDKKNKLAQNKVCPICDTINKPELDFCEKCNSALNLKLALESEKATAERLNEMENKLKELPEQITELVKLFKNDPNTLKKALQIKKDVKRK